MDPSSETKDGGHGSEPAPTASELFSSARVVAGAAQACFQSGADKVDQGKVAGAAADLLGAASHYGKLEEKGYGEYVEKAETYLEQYSSGGSAAAAAPAAAPAAAAAPAPAPADPSPAPPQADQGEEAKPEGAAGDSAGEGLLKAARGFLGGL